MHSNRKAPPPHPDGRETVRVRAGTVSPALVHISAHRHAEELDRNARQSFRDGVAVGKREGMRAAYRRGFWRGYGCGALAGLLAGAALVAGALALGLQVPPLWG